MSTLQIVVLAVVQGVTEFIPISSSGHLALVPLLTGWPDQGVLIDVAAHVGTLGAVIVYLRRDMATMVLAVLRPWRDDSASGLRLVYLLAAATVPVAVVGALVQTRVEALRSIPVIALATFGYGIVLYVSDRWSPTVRRVDGMSLTAALWIGVSQVLALVPGTSRAGITMTAARFLGFQRVDAARFSMLLSIPTILAAGTLATAELIEAGSARLGTDAAIVAVLSFVTALVTIMLMMRWLARATFVPFVVYRVVFGAGLLLWWFL